MQKTLFVLLVAIVALFAGVVRCWNIRDVLFDGGVYFTEADAYSRMTRVQMIAEGKGLSIRHHAFENWPQGTTPHTTAPMDWTILALRPLASAVFAGSALRDQALDAAGALAGPLLGVLACIGIALALPKNDRRERWFVIAALLLFAVSPILVHGTLLGRPDHQALLILLLGFALSAEVRLLRAPAKSWAIAAGIAWGLALWTSLYEPLILLVVTAIGLLISRPATLRDVGRGWQWTAIAGVFVVGLLIDGWRVHLPDAALRDAFGRWSASIGEMQALNLKSGTQWNWLGWLLVPVPVILFVHWNRRSEARLAVLWLAATFALTLWQLRWGYFLAVVFVVTLPLALSLLPRAWMGWVAYAISLWPTMGDWDRRLYPGIQEEQRSYVARREQKALREIAMIQRERNAGPFVAPWWLSPPLAYWSRQPGIAGSSHESLPGIIDSAKIYLAVNDETALPVLRARQAKWILSDVPERLVSTSSALLGVPPPDQCLANKLAEPFLDSPVTDALRPVRNEYFQVWRVPSENEPQLIEP